MPFPKLPSLDQLRQTAQLAKALATSQPPLPSPPPGELPELSTAMSPLKARVLSGIAQLPILAGPLSGLAGMAQAMTATALASATDDDVSQTLLFLEEMIHGWRLGPAESVVVEDGPASEADRTIDRSHETTESAE